MFMYIIDIAYNRNYYNIIINNIIKMKNTKNICMNESSHSESSHSESSHSESSHSESFQYEFDKIIFYNIGNQLHNESR